MQNNDGMNSFTLKFLLCDINKRINTLKFQKDMKKDYYKAFPDMKTLLSIKNLNSQIQTLEKFRNKHKSSLPTKPTKSIKQFSFNKIHLPVRQSSTLPIYRITSMTVEVPLANGFRQNRNVKLIKNTSNSLLIPCDRNH
jgi:hypothetical protein